MSCGACVVHISLIRDHVSQHTMHSQTHCGSACCSSTQAEAEAGTMELHIEPSSYDVIVASTGLVECLVASALVRAGKSVLVLDQADVYGHDHASYTPAALLGSQDPRYNPHASLVMPRSATTPPELPAGLRFSPCEQGSSNLTPGGLPFSGVSKWTADGTDSVEQDSRSTYILDLAPKMLYQAEPLVDALVHTRSHHYLEFKAVSSSFIYQGGRLQPIPASRADIFKDKSLGLNDKRVLMQFLSRCIEAREGRGPLVEYMSSHQPMTELLTAQGLSQPLQDVVLYGICMAHTRQPAAAAATAPPANSNATTASQQGQDQAAPSELSVPLADAAAVQPVQGVGVQLQSGAPALTAAEGLTSLILYAESTGRFGTTGALMFPRYGSGSLCEALVRHCAVKGAVTALRAGIAGVITGPRRVPLPCKTEQQPCGDVNGDDSDQPGGTRDTAGNQGKSVMTAVNGTSELQSGTAGDTSAGGTSASTTEPDADTSAPRAAAGGTQVVSQPRAAGGSAATGVGGDADDETEVVRGIVLEGGQLLECRDKLLLGGRLISTLLPTSANPSASAGQPPAASAQDSTTPASPHAIHQGTGVARAVVLLDGPLHEGCSLCSVVLAPGCVQGGSTHPVYGLQLSWDTAVVPKSRCLLYLSTASSPAESATAQQLLEPTVAALAHLGPSPQEPAPEGSPAKPRVLEAFYYTQQLHDAQPGTNNTASITACGHDTAQLPSNVVMCPGPWATLYGYQHEVAAAKQLLTSHFPGVTWLLDQGAENEEQGSEGEGQEESDADIDELEAALKSLANLQPTENKP